MLQALRLSGMDKDALDFYLTHWGSTILAPFFDCLRKASKAELRDLHRRIKAHAKETGERWHLISVDSDQRSSHSFALAAVNWEARRRSKLFVWLQSAVFPIRRWWSGFWSGKDLQKSDHFGLIAVGRKGGTSLFHIYGLRRWVLKIVVLPLLQYIARNANWIVPTIVTALVAIYVAKEYGK
jgi:hypothetical protein